MVQHRPLRNIILATFLSTAIPVLVGLGITTLLVASNFLSSLQEARISHAARSLENLVIDFQQEAVSHLHDLETIISTQPEGRRFTGFSPRLISLLPSVSSVLLTDREGMIVDTLPPAPDLLGNDLSRQPYFQKALDEVSWSESFIDWRTGSATVALSGPFQGGACVFLLDLSTLQRRIESLEFSEGASMAISDRFGTTIAHTERGFVDRREPIPWANRGPRPTAYQVTDAEGRDALLWVRPLGESGWTFYYSLPSSTLWLPLANLSILTLLILVLSVGIASTLLLARVNRLTRPFAEFTQAAVNIGSGVYVPIQVPPNPHEFLILGNAINEMCQSILSREQAILELNRTLEARVEARTQDLSQAVVEANAANQAKSTFLANMSHEIRTPMNAIMGFAQLMEHDPTLSAASRGKLKTILRSGEHLLHLVNDVLDMARIEAGKVELLREDFDFLAILDEVATVFAMRAEQKGLEFALIKEDGLPRWIQSDKSKLRQLLFNLLGNALKFTKKGSLQLVVGRGQGELLWVEVRDTGIGIAPHEIQRLFQAFERTESGARMASGTGLGLVISREFARMLQGDLSVTSTPEVGSCFRLEFLAPSVSSPSETGTTPGPVPRVSGDHGEVRVLVVDDQVANREVLAQLLTLMGFVVDQAGSASEALSAMRSQAARLVFMDLRMPDVDGAEATKLIRAEFPDPGLVIIGISASAFVADQDRFREAGIDALLTKPFLEQELHAALQAHVGYLFSVPSSSGTEHSISLDKMPREWREGFAAALLGGSPSEMRKYAEKAALTDPNLAAHLVTKIEEYDFAQLRELLERP